MIDPSEELLAVANVFLRWYKLFRQTSRGKLPRRYQLCALFLSGIAIIVIKHIIVLIVIIVVLIRLLGLFKTVFPYRNGSNRLIMDTEKVHSIKRCHLDVINYAYPINCC